MSHPFLKLPLLVFLLTVITTASALKSRDDANGTVVAGSGFVMSESRTVGDFKRIALHTFAEVAVNAGEEYSVRISAEDNLIPLLATYERDGWLVIEGPEKLTLQPTRPILVMITMPTLDGVDLSGDGSIHVRRLHESSIAVSMDGIGIVALSGEVHEQVVNMAGTGRYNGTGLTCDHAAVTISGVGSAELYVREELNATITGSGSVIYSGDPEVTSYITGDGALIHH